MNDSIKVKIYLCTECPECGKKQQSRYCNRHNIRLEDFPDKPEWCMKDEIIFDNENNHAD